MRTLSSIVAILAGGSLLTGCSQPQAGEPAPPQPVQAQLVTEAPPPPGVRYSASIEPFDQVSLAFKASGYVESLARRGGADGRMRAAQAGDRVTRGAVLATVRDADYRERVAQGQAKLAEGQASLVKARLDLERARTLFEAESLTRPDLDAAQASFDAAEARVAAASAELELARIALRDCALVAPAAGVILERHVEVGTLASAGMVGFVVGDLTSVKARFGIPDSMIGSVRPGAPIAVAVEAVAATTFAGRVTAVAPAADPQSRVFDVEITIPNGDGRLRPGMIGTVVLDGPAGARLPSVPLAAIVRSDADPGAFAVVVVERRDVIDVARQRRVELGEVTGNGITVLKGIAAGERVVVSGATLLTDGEPVRVLP